MTTKFIYKSSLCKNFTPSIHLPSNIPAFSYRTFLYSMNNNGNGAWVVVVTTVSLWSRFYHQIWGSRTEGEYSFWFRMNFTLHLWPLLRCFSTTHTYSTPRGETDKLEEPVNRELNVTRSWNFIHIVNLAWFIDWMSFKLICIFYNFKAPLLENH